MTSRGAIPFAAMSVMGDRVRAAREALGLSQSELARRVGVTPQAVQAIEAGTVKTSRHIHRIAHVLQKPPHWLAGEAPYALTSGLVSGEAPVRGIVAAGLWQVESSFPDDQASIPASPDPRYARMSQVAFRVVGNSMDNIVRDGEYVICLDYAQHPVALRSGDVVVAERKRGGEVERTVKRVQMGASGPELWPDSTSPAHTKPLILNATEMDTTVEVVGLVIGYFRPAR